MIPFSRILLCLTLHYLMREKERLSTCINNAFTFNYFCTFFYLFFLCYSMEYNSMVSIHCLYIYFCTFFFFNIFYSIYKQVQFFMLYSKQAQPRENTKKIKKNLQLYNCTHPCTPMRLYFCFPLPYHLNKLYYYRALGNFCCFANSFEFNLILCWTI